MNKLRYSLLAAAVLASPAWSSDHPAIDIQALSIESSQLTNSTSRQAVSALAGTLGFTTSAALGQSSGLPAGDMTSNMTPWSTYGFSESDYQFLAVSFEKDSHNLLVGADSLLGNNKVLGISAGIDTSEALQIGGTAYQDRRGLIIAPYFGVALSDSVMLDATIGYADYDNKFFSGFVGDTAVDFDSEKWFAESNINYFKGLADGTELMINGGVMWAIETNDQFTFNSGLTTQQENTVRILQLKIGATLSKTINNMTPYVSATYNYDVSTGGIIPGGPCTPPGCIDPEKDKQDIQMLVGANWRYDSGMLAGLEAGNRVGRENLNEFVFNANLRIDL